jgi:hypothetical protein
MTVLARYNFREAIEAAELGVGDSIASITDSVSGQVLTATAAPGEVQPWFYGVPGMRLDNSPVKTGVLADVDSYELDDFDILAAVYLLDGGRFNTILGMQVNSSSLSGVRSGLFVRFTDSDELQILLWNGSTFYSATSTQTFPNATGYVIRIRKSGANLTAHVNGSEVISVSDAPTVSYSSSGRTSIGGVYNAQTNTIDSSSAFGGVVGEVVIADDLGSEADSEFDRMLAEWGMFHRTELFIGDRFKRAGTASGAVTEFVKQPRPTFVKDAWDAEIHSINVIARENRFHMVYVGISDNLRSYPCYAFSDDQGSTWTKPNLGRVAHVETGNSNNNILFDLPSPGTGRCNDLTVVPDSSGNGLGFVMHLRELSDAATDNTAYIYTAQSLQGEWSLQTEVTSNTAHGTYLETKGIFYVPQSRRWIMPFTAGHLSDDRSLYYYWSETSDPRTRWHYENNKYLDAPNSANQYYKLAMRQTSGATPWGIMQMYNSSTEVLGPLVAAAMPDGRLTYLGGTLLDNGGSGEFDEKFLITPGIVTYGGKHYMIYSGSSVDHSVYPRDTQLGLATLEENRFSYITNGTWTTSILPVGSQTSFDVELSGAGKLTYSLIDFAGSTLDGYSESDCTPLSASGKLDWVKDLPSGAYSVHFNVPSGLKLHRFNFLRNRQLISDLVPLERSGNQARTYDLLGLESAVMHARKARKLQVDDRPTESAGFDRVAGFLPSRLERRTEKDL